ncbi:trigger factor [Herbinix luporum]|uniref:peptidylprolyl isomerase n=1 Tax=Herbinix luporum TaxID=1679721 RepID=A0A0K8J8D0_9FIRM|nr:trigger factor [Herbinix luporum]CUH93840.1 hypothetical protein SD1D_2328 [Herbinix luporum]
MKKIIALMVLCLSIMLAVLGCGKDKGKDEEEGKQEETLTPVENEDNDTETVEPMENPIVKEDYDYNDYIKLGKYKGIEVKLEKLEVDEIDIDIAIQQYLIDHDAEPIEVTDRAVQLGDIVNIDFVGYHNGEPFEGGSAEDYDLIIGSGAFIEGFEDQLIGANINDEVEVNVVFPEDYPHAKMAGEPALFKVKLNGIKYYELTDDILKSLDFETEEAYRESLRQELEENNQELMENKRANYIYDAVVKASEITLPENLVEYYLYDFKVFYHNYAASANMTLENFVTMNGYSMEEFEADQKDYADRMATRELIIKAISAAEGIEITEDEFQDRVTEYANEQGFESNEEFLEYVNADVIREDLLYDKIIQFLIDESVEA